MSEDNSGTGGTRPDDAHGASGHYRVRYTYPGSIFEAVSTDLGAYSASEAGERVRASVYGKDVTILDVTRLGDPEPVACTYNGGPAAVYPEGPWVFMGWVDRHAPLLVCDVHGHPAHPNVYESETEPGHYAGPCQHHPEPFRPRHQS